MLVTGTFFDGVTLSAFSPEDFVAGLGNAGRSLIEGRHSRRKRGIGLRESKEKGELRGKVERNELLGRHAMRYA